MSGTDWGHMKLKCQQWMRTNPPKLFPYNEDTVKVQTTTVTLTKKTNREQLCAPASL